MSLFSGVEFNRHKTPSSKCNGRKYCVLATSVQKYQSWYQKPILVELPANCHPCWCHLYNPESETTLAALRETGSKRDI